jgi:hypothetical protein
VSDPSKAASPSTQRLALAGLILLYIAYLLAAGTGGLLVLPMGAFLLLGIGTLAWRWWTGRREKQAG